MIARIAGHEWRRQRAGLSFWLLLAITQLLMAWLTFAQLEGFAAIAPQLKAADSTIGATDLVIVPTLNTLVLLLLLVCPLLAMGSLAGEARSGRMALWLSSPVSSAQIIGGKVLGLWLTLLPLVLTVCLTLGLLALGIDFDARRFALAAAGMLVLAMWLAAIAVMLSGLFDHPAAALAATCGVLLFLWLLDSLGGQTGTWNRWALLPHVEPLLRGLLRMQDVVYFVATGLAAWAIAIHRLDRRRGLA